MQVKAILPFQGQNSIDLKCNFILLACFIKMISTIFILTAIKNISGIAMLISITIKISIHLWLDYKNSYFKFAKVYLYSPQDLFKSYKKEVQEAHLNLRAYCNSLPKTIIVMLLVNALSGISILFIT